jgi:glycosyltransferase involved in cell wall biosynthesis
MLPESLQPPLVSVVIPAFNRERYIAETLSSVQAQSVASWEVVVFDDGSSDGTVDVVGEFAARDARIRLASGTNGGVSRARNRGLALTDRRSKFVVFLDSDDIWEPEALAALVAALDANPRHSSAHALAKCVDPEGRPIQGDDLIDRMVQRKGYRGRQLLDIDPDCPTTFAEMVVANYIVTPGLQLIRREVLEKVGANDPDVDPASDWDLAIRLSREGSIAFVRRPLLKWRRHPGALTQSSINWSRAHRAVRRKTLRDSANTREQRSMARFAYLDEARESARSSFSELCNGAMFEALRQAGRSGRTYLGLGTSLIGARKAKATPAIDIDSAGETGDLDVRPPCAQCSVNVRQATRERGSDQ